MKTNRIYIIMMLVLISFSSLVAKEQSEKIKIMYFHGTMRCEGCITLENNIIRSVESLFGKEIKSGSFEYQSIDFLEEGNEHFGESYKVDSQTLIISKVKDGKELEWVNLEKVWDFAGDYKKMKKYIDREVKKLLN